MSAPTHGMVVDFADPPPYTVVVTVPDVGDVTWPFQTEAEARAAYDLALASGQFRHVMKKSTKKRPGRTVDVVSLWRLNEAGPPPRYHQIAPHDSRLAVEQREAGS